MTYLWSNVIILTANEHVIMKKDARYLLKKFTQNTSTVVSKFLLRELRLGTLINWNHPPYIWQFFILIYLMKAIRMLELRWHMFIFFFNLFLQKGWYLHFFDNRVGSPGWSHKSVLLWIGYLSTKMSCFIFLYYYWKISWSIWTCKIYCL